MKKLIYFLSIFTLAALVFVGCRKVDVLPNYASGAKVNVTASATTITPTQADSAKNVVTFTWTSPKYSIDTSRYKFILEVDSAGKNFSNPFRKEVQGKQEVTLTGKEINAYLLNRGYRLGTPVTLEARIVSSHANNNERLTSDAIKITVTPYTDPSVLTTSATTVTGSLATQSQVAATFNWTRAFSGYSGNVTYVIQYDSAGKNFANAKEIAVGDNITTRQLTQGEINQTALDVGVKAGTAGKVDYRIKATTAQGAVSFSNAVSVTVNTYQPIVRLYMPGSYQASTGQGTDWTPGNAPELIRDMRPEALNKLYYTYIYLPANTEFKITDGRSWDVNYGGTNGNLSRNGDNLRVTSAGWYRVSVDLANMKYDIRQGRMGFVGGATPPGWNPGATFPNYAMGAAATNLFVGITDFTTGEWKLIDHNDWNNGDISATNVRSYGSNGPSGSTVVTNGPNFPSMPSAGRYRVIWDGRNRDNVVYFTSPANQMRLVGDGINQAGVGDWDPGTSPQMTYQGNGVWTITIALKANKDIKFLAGNAWGAFDYEDASGGSQAVGTPRKINWDGGPNFKTPAVAGTYTVRLDEYNQTMTISQ